MPEIPRYPPFDTPKSNDELYIEIENILNDLEATLAIFELEQDTAKAKQVEILIYELKKQQILLHAENHKKIGKLGNKEKTEKLLKQAQAILQGNEASLARFDLERENEMSHIPLPPEELEAKYFNKEDIAISNALLAFNISELFSIEEFESSLIVTNLHAPKKDNQKIQEAVEIVTDFLVDNQALNYFCENAEFASIQTAINIPPDLIWIKEKNPKVWQALNILVKSKKGPDLLRLLAGQPVVNTNIEATEDYDLMAKEALDASPNIFSLAINMSRQRLKSSTRQDLSEEERNLLVNLYGTDFLKDKETERARDIIFERLLNQILKEEKTEVTHEAITQIIEMLQWKDVQKMIKNNQLEHFETILQRIKEYLPQMTDGQIKIMLEKMNVITSEALKEPDNIQKRKDAAQKRKERLENRIEGYEEEKNTYKNNILSKLARLAYFGVWSSPKKTQEEIENKTQEFDDEKKNYERAVELLFILLTQMGNIARKLIGKEDWGKRNKEFADFCTKIFELYSKLQKHPLYREKIKDEKINNFDGFVTSYKKYQKESILDTVIVGEPEYKIVSTLDKKKELDLSEASLVGADFRNATLSQINLTNSDLTNANFEGADFRECKIEGAKFDMNNNNVPQWIKYGLDENGIFSKTTLEENIKDESQYRDLNLQGAILYQMDLSGIDLRVPNFKGADLTLTNFTNSDLRNVNFRDANLTWTNFTNSDLRNADFRGASFTGTIFENTNLEGAKFDKKNKNLPKKIKERLNEDGIFKSPIENEE